MLHARRALGTAAAAFFLFILAGCSSSHTIVLRRDGSGTMSMHVEVSRVLHDYIASLAEMSGTSGSAPADRIFDLGAIRKGFQAQPGLTVEKLSSPNPSVLDVELSFDSLSDIFSRNAGLGSSQALVLSDAGDLKTLKIHLDKSTYRQLAVMFPLLESPVLQSLGPQADQKVSADDYLEMVRFALGDEAPTLVKTSFILIAIRPEGEVVSQTGGTTAAGGVVFRIPLLRLLVLDSPLDFSVTYR